MNFAEMLKFCGAAEVLRGRYLLEAQLSSPGSITGHQVERAELGLASRPPDGGRFNTQEIVRAQLADFTLLCRDLNKREEVCCRLRYSEVAGAVGYSAVRRLCDLREGDGEEVSDVRPRDYDGKPLDGYVRVKGKKTLYPSFEQIAAAATAMLAPEHFTANQVSHIVATARAKIDRAIRWRAFAAAVESGYE